MKRAIKVVYCILLGALSVALAIGCSDDTAIYHGKVRVEWMNIDYTSEQVYFDNDWLQEKSFSAAAGLNLQNAEDFLVYLDELDPLLRRYFVQDHELTSIIHYCNGIWAVRYALPEDVKHLGYDATIYYIDEATGKIINYECWSNHGVAPWE